MLLTSWIRVLRQSFARHRLSRARRKQAESRRQNLRHARLAEVLEERSLLSVKPLVIDINSVTGTNVFTSTASSPGINITNSTLDPNNDGISDFDDLVIGVSQSSTFESTIVSGAGIGIRINLSNLVGLNHITIDNVIVTAGANQQGISVTLDNVALQSLAVDQAIVTASGANGVDISLKNMNITTGVDVSIQNSNIRTGNANFNGVNVSLESVSKSTHVGELTLTDSVVEGFNVATSSNSLLYAAIDQASARNNRIQDGAANPAARGITYNLTRTVVGDLRIEDNLRLRNVAVTATNSPLQSVSISDNTNTAVANGGFDVSGFVATDPIRDAIRINAISTNAAGTQRSDVTNLRISGNTITGSGQSAAAAPTVNGIVLNLTDSNLGSYTVANAGATITGNTIQNLSSGSGGASGISVTASATSTFVTGNGNQPLLLDFNGDGTANDVNGIVNNTLTANNGRGMVVSTQANTNFQADFTGNTVDGGAAANRREGVSLTFTDRPTNAAFDSFNLNFSGNTINNSAGTGLSLGLQNTAVGSFVIDNNQFLDSGDSVQSAPDALAVTLTGTSVTQEATNILRKSFITDNFIGVTQAGAAAGNNGNGIFVNAQEQSSIQDLHITGNLILNNGDNGISFLREDQSTLRTVDPEVGQNRAITIANNTVGLNGQNGILIDARNGSVDLLDFEIRSNLIGTDSADPTSGNNLANEDDGIELVAQADARLLVDLSDNTVRFNEGNGVHVRDVFGNFTTDKRQVGGTWINNTISDNDLSGIVIRGRHGLSDETTGITTPLVIGLEGQGNNIENNGGNGIRIFEPLRNAAGQVNNAIQSVATGEVSITNNLIVGNSSIDLPNEPGNTRGGIYIQSAQEKVDIQHNQIEANFGKGIDIQVVHGIPTLPTDVGLAGVMSVFIRDNVVTGQIADGGEDGDGVELSGFEIVSAFTFDSLFNGPNGLEVVNRSDNSRLNRMDVLVLNNFIDSNAGRGIDMLNIGNGTMQVRIGDNTLEGRNTIVGNRLDGIRVMNSVNRLQNAQQDGVPTAGGAAAGTNGINERIGAVPAVQNNDAAFSPDIMLDVAGNTIRDNGIGMPASVQSGGISEVNGTGLVVLAGGAGNGLSTAGGGALRVVEDSFGATHPNEVGRNSGDPLQGNGRVNLRVSDNRFEGNFGNDVSLVPYVAVVPPQTAGAWDDPVLMNGAMIPDPLVRLNVVMTGNTGNGIDVIRPAVDYNNDEPVFKSRLNASPPRAPTGPFGSGTRPRNSTRLASDGNPVNPANGYSFVYPGMDEGANNRQTGNGTVSAQATTLRVEAGFDRSGTTAGFAFFDPAAPGPGSDDNFDDHSVGNNPIVNGRVDTIWDTVTLGSFTFPNVDAPSNLRASVTPFATPRSSTPGVVTINFSEFVRFVDITDFRLLRDGVVVPLESSPGVPLAVSPIASSQDPNNIGAFMSFTLDLSGVATVSGDYELQVLAVDASNPTFTPIRDVHLQLSNQGNTLVRVIDGDGVLQDFSLSHEFTIDSARPVASISPITPDPRNAAAGIVTIDFDEPVTGVDLADFELYRTVGASTVQVNLGSISVTQISDTRYTLNLNQLSGAPGDYELRVVSTDVNTPVQDLAGNLVSENVSVGVAASDLWTVDTTLPFVTSIADSLASTSITSPRNAQPGSVILNFSETVVGLDVSDLSLSRTNADGTVTNISLSGFTLFSLSGSQYELNLAGLASDAGTYTLTLNPLNSGITDVAGNAFLTADSATWVLDTALPLADIVDVAPDPRQTPVDALNTIYSEAVTGVNTANAAAHYVLAYDDGTPMTSGSISNATNSGPIVVTSAGHNLANLELITIFGVNGNTTANGVFQVRNVTANTFELFTPDGSGTAVSGNGIYTSGGRWVRNVSLAGLTISQESDTRYVLNLASRTLDQGIYVVSLLANSGITDVAGNAVGPMTDSFGNLQQFNVAAQDIWTNGPDAAPTGTIDTITSPRGTSAGVVTVTFSEPLAKINGASPVDAKDFRLTRTVGATTTTISLAGVTITQTGPTTYTLDLTGSGITDIDGNYVLQLLNTDTSGASATPLRDLTGNLLSDDSDPGTAAGIAHQVTWTKTATLSGPQVTSFLDVQRNNLLGSITKLRPVQTLEITFSENVTGIDLTDASKNFLLTRQATGGVAVPVSLDGVTVQQVTANKYRITLTSLTGSDGTYRFTVLANGLIKNSTTLVELKNPQTVTWTKDGTLRPTAGLTDSVDTNQGNEVAGSGSTYSLRQAIQEANALAGDDVIELGAGTYSLSLFGVQEDLAAVGDLDIRENLIIRGKGVGTTIIDATALFNRASATERDRLFQILSGVTVTIQGVTIQKGFVTGSEDGGAIRNAGNLTILDSLVRDSRSLDDAGAINNTGTLTIARTTISSNVANATGGAIRNAGTLNMTASTLSGNFSGTVVTGTVFGNGASNAHGGGLMNVSGFTATLENVTVSGNTSRTGTGGGIRNDGTLRLINDTIASNVSLSTGAGISRNLGTVTIGNTIVTDNRQINNTLTDTAGAFVSLGGNIVRTPGTATGFIGTDQLNANPNLQPLGNYGGPTQTHSLLANSIAIDRGINANVTDQTASSQDQRGGLRFLDGPAVGSAVDAGAVEFGTFFVNTTDDSPDVNPGDGLAEDGLQQTSLRAAVMESNALAGESAIILDGQVYSLKRLSPDTTPPRVVSITGVPLAPITTGGVGVVTITFSERVAGFDLSDITLTRNGTPIALSPTTFVLEQDTVNPLIYRIKNRADIANNVTNTGLTSLTNANNGLYSLTINAGGAAGSNIRDIENNFLASAANVNWVRGTDTFAPTVTMTADSAVVAAGGSDFITNGGTVTVTFSERVNGVSANNFTLTRNGTPVTGLVVTPVTDNNFGGRTTVTLNLATLSAPNGNYVLTLNPNVGANVTIKDTANNNLAAGASISWSKVANVRFEPINNPRVDEVLKVRLQFTERVAGLIDPTTNLPRLEDFTLTYDDGTGIGPQTVDLSQATLTPVGAVTAVPGFGNAAEQWELSFNNKQAARDGQYVLNFDGQANGNQLVTTATTAMTVVPFTPTTATLPFQIGEDLSAIGDLDVIVGAGRVQIFGKGQDDSTTVLGNNQPRTVIDGNLTDRIFDLTIGSNVSFTGVEMIKGRVVYERDGGAIRNLGTLTINDSDVGATQNIDNDNLADDVHQGNTADGNGGAIFNAAPSGQIVALSGTLQIAALATDATLTLNSVANFPVNAPFVILVDSEQMQVTAVNVAANQFTVSRGFNGTTAAAHAANADVTLLSSVTINRSSLHNNLAGSTVVGANSGSNFGRGGAIYNENGAIVINDSTFARNAATTDGGAIFNGNAGTVGVLSSTLGFLKTTSTGARKEFGNSSGRDGGAIYNNDTAFLTINTSTLSFNRADSAVNGNAADLDGDGGAIYNETSARLTLDDALLQNNTARNGGALYNDDGTLILNRDTFGGNSAIENGGAVFNTSGGSISLNQGLFTTNTANDNGGAIQNFGQLDIIASGGTGTQFLSNEAGVDGPGDTNDDGLGGAIFNQDGVVTISQANFTLNRSHGDAGVIYNDGDSTLTITRTTFDRNRADRDGGVLYNNDFSQLTIDESTFSNNTATRDGGAVYNNSTFTNGPTLSLTVDDSTFNNNTAARGGAIFNQVTAGLTMQNSTLSANDATTSGGGLFNYGSATLLNDTLFLNDAPLGAGIDSNSDGSSPLALVNLKNTIVAGGSASADIAGFDANFADGGHNLIEDIGTVTTFGTVGSPANGNLLGDSATPLNPQLDDLKDNGGPTFTHALLFGSPARDTGDNFATTAGDQRGFNRIFDGDGNGVATIDIGSFESGFVVNSFLDTVDENPGDGINADANGQSTLRSAIMEANARAGEDTIILGAGIFTLTLTGRNEDFRLNAAGNIASTSETGDLDILDDLNIIGAGTDLTFIDANFIDRLFQVFPNVTLNLSNLTLRNGNATSTDFGGAVFNQGTTTLDNVLVIDSRAGRGGGIYNDAAGTVRVTDSLFRGNLAVQQGGALYNDGDLTMTTTDIGAVSRLSAAVTAAATTITLTDVSDFPTAGPFVIQVDAERMLVTAIAGNQFTVTRGFNGTVATAHSAAAFATLGNFANIHGGGLFNLGTATVNQVTFAGNLAESRGGGLYNAAVSGLLTVAVNNVVPTLTLTSVAGFPTSGSFIIQVDSEQMQVTAVNAATNTLTVVRGFAGTVAAAHAVGAVVATVGENQVEITQSTFLDNFASSRGAAIYNEETLEIRNSTLSNNDAGVNAAIANSISGRVTINNSTVVDNVAFRGGGLANSIAGSVNVQNTIVANNASTSISGVKAPNVRGTFVSANNNFIGNNADSSGFANGVNSDQVGSGTSPFDPVLQTLADNGGATQTHAARVGSPIIDAGNNTGGDPFDQRGAIRPTNSDSDIGSVEQQDVHVTINDVALQEGDSESTIFTFTLSLNQTSVQEVRVRYSLQGDTAFAGEDFIDATGEVVFAPNQLNQTLDVIVNGDRTIEPDETFLVNLSIDSNAAFTPVLDRKQAVGTILSDDRGIRITDVNKVEQDNGAANQMYVFSVSVVGATLAPNETVSVDYTIVDGTATIADGDYLLSDPATGTLTFTAGPNGELPAAQTITALVAADQDVEGNETFFVDLSNLTSSVNTLGFEFDKSRGIGTIFNDDLSFTITGSSANEADPPATTPLNFTVTLDQRVYVSGVNGVPTQATVTALVSTASGTATSGQDFVAINNQVVTFSGTTLSQTVTATILGDLRFEKPDETFQLQVTGGTINGVADANAAALSTAGIGTIVDFDPPPDQYHVYTYFDNGGTNTNHIRIDRIASGVRTMVPGQDYDLAVTPNPIIPTVFGDFGGVDTDDLFAIDFNLYDSDNPADFAQYDTTGVIDNTHVLGVGQLSAAGSLSVDGLDEVGADTVRFQGGALFLSVVYDSINPGSGSVTFDDGSIFVVNYDGLEPILDNTTADSRTFNAPSGTSADTIAVSSSGGLVSISGPTFESVTALAPAGALTINAGGGNDTITVNGSDPLFTAVLTVNGDDGNDSINLSGWGQTSTVNGALGNDTITGGSNDDLLDGGDDNDTITGGGGNDSILGGSGTDSLAGGDGNDTIDGGDGNDTVQGNDGVDSLTGGNDNDTVDGGAGDETVDGGLGDDVVTGGDGNDVVLGNDGNDTLNGGTGNDSLDGGFGDDSMSGDAGTDTVNGQSGSDIVSFIDTSTANNTFTLTNSQLTVGTEIDALMFTERAFLVAGSGNNRMDATGFSGTVTMNGGAGLDTLLGGTGDDSLIGGTGNDSLVGNNGNDTINAGDGNDCITGNSGDDSITAGLGADTIDGGSGNDSALGEGGNDTMTGGDGIDTLEGGDGQDTLSGDANGDSLLGDAGQDSIDGGDGDDSIDGGIGDDTAFGQDGNDDVRGGDGNDTLEGNLGDDSVNGMDGNDTLNGNEGSDTLFGGAGDDELISTDGNDQLLGQGGAGDKFTFDGDNTTLAEVYTITLAGNGFSPPTGIGLARLNPGFEFTTVILGVEVFTLNLNGGNDLVTLGDLADVTDLTVLNINGGDGNDTIDGSLNSSTTVSIRSFLGLGADSVQGGAAADTVFGEAGNDTIIANDGDDSVVGGDGNDSLNGNAGNDTIQGNLGDDSMWGGGGSDVLNGSDGMDTILGQAGNDTIDGGIGDDFLDGGHGDSATSGTGNDSIRGGAGNDKIAGRDGADRLFGDDGNDTIKGGEDADSIDGGNGNDLISGDQGNDTLNGAAGNDFLLGGTDNDRILGGAGNDTCVGEAGNDTIDGQGGTDKVLGGNGTGTNTKSSGDRVTGSSSEINELFKITTARPNIFNELNF